MGLVLFFEVGLNTLNLDIGSFYCVASRLHCMSVSDTKCGINEPSPCSMLNNLKDCVHFNYNN